MMLADWNELMPMLLYPSLAGLAGVVCTLGTISVSRYLSPRMLSSYKSFSPQDKDEWNSKFAHILHAVVCVLLVWVAVTRTPEFIWTDGPDTAKVRQSVLLATNVYSASAFMFSIGYFLADMFMMLTVQPNNVMMVHHLSGCICLIGSLITGCCHFYGLLLLSTEVTTPLICLRWLLDKAQRKGTQLYLINAVCIVITWVLSRILLFVYLFLHMWEHRDVLDTFPFIVKVSTPGIGIILSCLNLTWFARILRGALVLLSKQSEPSKEVGSIKDTSSDDVSAKKES